MSGATASDYSREAVLVALRTLGNSLRSDILADGTIAQKFKLGVQRPIQLTAQDTVERDLLFSAFREAADWNSGELTISREGSTFAAKVWLEGDACIVGLASTRMRFPHAALLATDPNRRKAVLRRTVLEHTLTMERVAKLSALVSASPLSNDDFLAAVEILSSSPETLGTSLSEKLKGGRVQEADLLPGDIGHWENLTAVPTASTSLTSFINAELGQEQAARLSRDVTAALRSISLTFASPQLVNPERFGTLEAGKLAQAIEDNLNVADFFALVGFFEICASRIKDGDLWVGLGDTILQQLFGDAEVLKRATQVFAAGLVFAKARLASHDMTREQSSFWRGLAAVAHASLVLRTCGIPNKEDTSFLSWAMERRGQEYFLCVLQDMALESRWRPEWADADFLVADVVGRARNVVHALGEAAPASWKVAVQKAEDWISGREVLPLMFYPGIQESARSTSIPQMSDLAEEAKTAFQKFEAGPDVDSLLRLMPLVHIFGAMAGLPAHIRKVVDRIRSDASVLDDKRIRAALALAAHAAVGVEDVELGEAIAITCLEKAREIKRMDSLTDVVFRIVECGSVYQAVAKRRQFVAKHLESLCFVVEEREQASQLLSLLESLLEIDAPLAPLMGRGLHAARLVALR